MRKKRLLMKSMTSTAPTRMSRSGCIKDRENMSADHKTIGKVSRSDLPTLRNAGGRVTVVTWLTMEKPRDQSADSNKSVVRGEKCRGNARHQDNGRVAPNEAEGKHGDHPHDSPGKKHGEEEKSCGQARQLRCAHPCHQKRRTEADAGQQAQRGGSRGMRLGNAADLDKLILRGPSSAGTMRPAGHEHDQRRSQQQLGAAEERGAGRPLRRQGSAGYPGRTSEEQVTQQPRG